MRNNDACPILPAGQCLFGKNKVTLTEINREWKKGTVVLVKKANGQPHFIAGASGRYFNIGQKVQFCHDQTGINYPGQWEVIDEIYYTTDAEGLFCATTLSEKQPPLLLKAALSVFK